MEEQLEKCQICLNRKNSYTGLADICNLVGNKTHLTGNCRYFDLDKKAEQRLALKTEGKDKQIKAKIRPTKGKAKLSILLIWVVLLFSSLSLLFSYWGYQVYVLGKEIDSNGNEIFSFGEVLITGGYFLSLLLSAIFFIQWFHTSYKNLEARGVSVDSSANWTIWGWFVPFFNLYKPYQIMKEMFDKTLNFIKTNKSESIFNRHSKASSNVVIWWVLWIVIFIINRVMIKIDEETDPESYFYINTIYDFMFIILSLITIKMIKSYQKMVKDIDK